MTNPNEHNMVHLYIAGSNGLKVKRVLMTGKYRTYGKQAYNEVALFLVGTVITSYLHFVGVRQYGKICHMITLACCVGGIGARYSAAFGGPLSSSLTRDV